MDAPDSSRAPDPFDTLGVPPRFDLAPSDIEAAYLARIAGAHPDRGGAAPFDAAVLNDARSLLRRDERRANALLARLGGPGPSDDKSLPDGFLMEMMETRSEIEEAIAGGGETERAQWEDWAEAQRRDYTARIAGLFAEAGDAASGSGSGPGSGPGSVLAAIRRELNAWRYIERLIEQLDPEYDPKRADFDPR